MGIDNAQRTASPSLAERHQAATGDCLSSSFEFKVIAEEAPYTDDDLARIDESCYHGQAISPKGFGPALIHLSNQRGEICVTREGAEADRVRKKCIDTECVPALGGGDAAKVKCGAISKTLQKSLGDPWYETALKEGWETLRIWAIFGAGMTLWQVIRGRWLGPRGPGGTSGSGDGLPFEHDSRPLRREMRRSMIEERAPATSPIKPLAPTTVGFLATAGACLMALGAMANALVGAATGALFFIAPPPGSLAAGTHVPEA